MKKLRKQGLKTAKEISIDLAAVDVFARWVKQLKGVTLQDNELERASFTAAERLFNDNKKKAAQKALTSYLENYPQGANHLQVQFLSAELYFQEEKWEAADRTICMQYWISLLMSIPNKHWFGLRKH